MYRCVIAANGSAMVHASAPGRGAWLCGPQCLDAAVTRRGFDRAWRAAAPASVGEDLRAAFVGLGLRGSVAADTGDDERERMGADHIGDEAHETMLMRAKG
jgi:hypothetical protein